MPVCSQCGRPAVASMGGQNLCVEHAAMLGNVVAQQQAHNAAMINMLTNQIEDVMGVPRSGPRIEIPQPTINHNQGHFTMNHISVNRSIVGAINTARVDQINVAIRDVSNQGNNDVAKAIKELSEAVLKSSELESESKDEVLESLTYLAQQAALPEMERQPKLIKRVLSATAQTLSAVADVTTIWVASSPQLMNFFIPS